jgi:ubiquinol-cytochrome c reductase iron-sulfur subunit
MAAADERRRVRLRGLTKLLFGIGLVLLAIPFLRSLQLPDETGTSRTSPWELSVDLTGLAEGEYRVLDWPGGQVGILHRSPQQLAALMQSTTPLQDPDSRHSRQPEAARNAHRSLQPEYFVFLARETLRQCAVRHAAASSRWPEGFDEACEGARFDLAGRIFAGSGHPDQRNLTVPPYRFIAPLRIRLQQP